MKKHKKLWIAAVTSALAASIAMGTFAWQSISQKAVNKAVRQENPGGRLHDDFNGSDKDIYIENYREEDEGALIYARIQLYEYLEIGEGAGEEPDPDNPTAKTAQSLVTGAKYDDTSTWYLHNPYDPDELFHTYFEWTEGGMTTYMPTFNKDNENLDADINGTLEGGTTQKAYGDYEDPTLVTTETEYEILDGGQVDTNLSTHQSKKTLSAEVLTMDEWIAGGCQKGEYWVYDEDGWAYWADGIEPQTATGCLIHAIKPKYTLKGDYFYGIEVVAQLITADEWAADEANEKYYFARKESEDEMASRNAIYLLEVASGTKKAIRITSENTSTKAELGSDVSMKASVSLGSLTLDNEKVAWSVEGNLSTNTKIDNNTGVLHIGEDELSTMLTVKATLQSDRSISQTYNVYTNAPIYHVTVTSNETVASRKNIVAQGNTMSFTALVTREDGEEASQNVIWKITEALDANGNSTTKASGTTITNGTLNVDAAESAKKLTVTAYSTLSNTLYGSYTVDVCTQFEYIPYIQVGSTEKVYIDGYHWYVLAKDSSKYLLWSYENISSNNQKWKLDSDTSYVGKWVCYQGSNWDVGFNAENLVVIPTLRKHMVQTELTTWGWNLSGGPDYTLHTYTTGVFMLSDADIMGTNGFYTYDAKEYTYNKQVLVTKDMMREIYTNGVDISWTRSWQHDTNWKVIDYSKQTCSSVIAGSTGIAAYGQAALWVQVN